METNKRDIAIKALIKASESWPEAFPRTAVPKVTNELYSVGYMANLDCRGEGPEGSVNIGRNKVYFRPNFVDWLIKRLEV